MANKVAGVLNFQIKGVKNVIFLNKISEFVAASSGSACSITHPSYTLKAIGLTDSEIENSIRFSLSPYEDISKLEDILQECDRMGNIVGTIINISDYLKPEKYQYAQMLIQIEKYI